MSVSITVNDGAVVAAIRQLSVVGKMGNLEMAARAGAMPILNDARRRAPKLTGNLARSIQISVVSRSMNAVKVAVGTNAVYAKMVEFGGVIVPKRARFLAWQTPAGEWIFARRVIQPSRPYLRPAFASQSAAARAAAFAALVRLAGLNGGNRAAS